MSSVNWKKVWNIVSTAAVILVVVLAVLLMGARVVGLRVFHVVSPSMEPDYGVGDLIYVKTVDPATVKEGDVITYVLNEELTVGTHRVVRVVAKNQCFYTKGDANKTPDAVPVHFKNLIGVPVFKLPLMGYVSNAVQTPPGSYLAVGGAAVLLVLVFLPDLLKRKPAAKQDQEADTPDDEAQPEQTQA